jgi:hypothetical protein
MEDISCKNANVKQTLLFLINEEYFMNKLLITALLAVFPMTAMSETTVYDASRLISADFDTTQVVGEAIVEDDGPFTPIWSVTYNAKVVPCDDGSTIQFSPRPPPCENISLDGNATQWSSGGHEYTFDTGETISIIRRGSVETGDPVLIVMDEDGNVVIFRERTTSE